MVTDVNYETSVSDDSIEGRPLKVLNVSLKFTDRPSILIGRYWIDLRRNGHVVRTEGYQHGTAMSGRQNIQLASFIVGNTEFWMPVSGENIGYVAAVDHKVVVTESPHQSRCYILLVAR